MDLGFGTWSHIGGLATHQFLCYLISFLDMFLVNWIQHALIFWWLYQINIWLVYSWFREQWDLSIRYSSLPVTSSLKITINWNKSGNWKPFNWTPKDYKAVQVYFPGHAVFQQVSANLPQHPLILFFSFFARFLYATLVYLEKILFFFCFLFFFTKLFGYILFGKYR